MSSVDGEYVALATKLEGATQDFHGVMGQFKSQLRQQTEVWRTLLIEQQGQIGKLQQALAETQALLAVREQEGRDCRMLRDEQAHLNHQLESVTTAYSQDQKKTQLEIAALQEKVAQQESVLVDRSSFITELQTALRNQEVKLNQTEADRSAWKATAEKLEHDLSTLRVDHQLVNDKLYQTETCRREERIAADSQLKMLFDKLRAAEETITTLQASLDRSRQEQDKQHATDKKRINSLQETVKKLETERQINKQNHDAVLQDSQSWQTQFMTVNAKFEQMAENVQLLSKDKTMAEAQVRALLQELREARDGRSAEGRS